MRAYFGVPPGTKVDFTWHLEGLFQQPAKELSAALPELVEGTAAGRFDKLNKRRLTLLPHHQPL